jgi:hypothetical protein
MSLVSMSMNVSGELQKVGNVYQLNIESKVSENVPDTHHNMKHVFFD